MSNLALSPLLLATWQTIYMVFISSFISIVLGLCIGAVLFMTQRGRALENRWLNIPIGFFVNMTRSVPFIILMISIIPLTRLIAGTSIGVNAAIVPLTITAIPFFARIAESAFGEVFYGVIEASHAMGATTWQIVCKVLIPESLPSLINGATLTIIGLIGYSAMAGAVGGGGLGELAINYGYQRFDVWVMAETVVLLIIIVQIIQSLGDHLAAKRKLSGVLIGCIVFWALCIGSQVWPMLGHHEQTIKVGIVSGVQDQIMPVAERVAEQQYHFKLKLVEFDDYVLPNTALSDGSINANIFQHIPYLNAQIKAHGYQLTPIAKTFIFPMGFYSRKIQRLSDLKSGSVVAVPNDPSNEGRALLLLQQAKIITLKKGVGLFGTLHDIVGNPLHLHFKSLDAAQLPRVLKDAALVGLTNDYVVPAGLHVSDALLKEGSNSPYANVIVVRTKDKDKPIFKKLIAVMHSKPVVNATLKLFPNGAAIKAWK